MADVYRRSGRGGAGNFYSQKEIEEARTGKAEDLEAQKSQHLPDDEPLPDPADVPAQPTTPSADGSRTYARSGRGGAGNFIDVPLSSTNTAAPSSPPGHQQPPPSTARNGHSGRGGAGNWTSPENEEGEGEGAYDPAQERRRREALDAHILEDIRESLPQPPKIHYMHGPGRGRKPDLLPTS
ncbi:hypothetical protein F4804DRAFT_100074 [Jackrogersella minutella]|nr:hypothetical protein F4804DRAFT_100074 [Jackrogersella minutella]